MSEKNPPNTALADLQSARNKEPIKIEMFYTLTCPNCKILKRLLREILPEFGDRFKFETTMANLPVGMVRTMKLGIYAVPTLLIDDEIVYREVPARQDLINKLKTY